MEASKAFVLQDNDEKPLEMEDVLDQGIQETTDVHIRGRANPLASVATLEIIQRLEADGKTT